MLNIPCVQDVMVILQSKHHTMTIGQDLLDIQYQKILVSIKNYNHISGAQLNNSN